MDTTTLFHTLNQKVRLLSKEANEVLQKYGLFSSQWTILYVLSEKGPMTQMDISDYIKVEAPTVTRTLTRLEESGWIVRKPGKDKREKTVELTEMAKNKYPIVKQSIMEFEQEFIVQLSQQEQQQLLNLLGKLGKGE
ncbi:MarR family winged helix-turn-helix transcriptional regulator [Cytobacillus sp. FJAT-54145]|uniref:MarR family winged helix-turn-helix transcriptional regulator n=1 Tax=Cytobacillus spartinae TaxID=3299023 RepID=A0ABW6KAR1_9BACI